MKGKTNVILSIMLLAMLAQFSMNATDGFPGFHGNGDCMICHNEPATAYNATYADEDITLDGLIDEPFWEETYGRRMEIPLGSRYGGEEEFVTIVFAQNSTHLFVRMDWDDPTINGSDVERFEDADGISIMWNARGDNFNIYYSGMKHPSTGGLADTWTWKAADADETKPFNSTMTGHIYDNAFDDNGWVNSDTTQDVKAGALHGYLASHSESVYSVEFTRALTTSDANDIQFDESKYYQFGLAMFNESSGSSHLMSFSHEVYVYNGDPVPVTETVTEIVTETNTIEITDTKSEAPLQIGFFVVSMFTIATIMLRRRK